MISKRLIKLIATTAHFSFFQAIAKAKAFIPSATTGRSQYQGASAVSMSSGNDTTTAKTAIVLIDPVTDFKQVIDAALGASLTVITIQMPDVALSDKFQSFLPSTQALIDAGATHTLSMYHRDVFSTTQQLQILARECNINIAGVIPLSEVAVEVSDLISSCLGLCHNPLELMTARRDKGLMKHAVELAGLRVAKYGRVGSAKDLQDAMMRLSLEFPVVIKTPSGMSTTDVYICSDENEAIDAIHSIVDKIGPDGRTVKMALLEEYIDGTEFAINLMAFNDGKHLFVTDMWKYTKTQKARYDNAEICNPTDYPQLTSYARSIAKAVGIKYGAAHVEVKAKKDEHGRYIEPKMIEIGARLSGGRKSTMAQCAIDDWDPFTSLIESHCGRRCQRISSNIDFLTPQRFVRHIFLPVEEAGRVLDVQLETSGLATLHSSAIIIKKGDIVKETTDIVSCAGFIWLVGKLEQVEGDTKTALSSFTLAVDKDDRDNDPTFYEH
mmetsp:Transcript_18611/g.39125  ORF Transcript_18611/g.39125 Transcript_18611/m.39125 type:complete len:496 (-) Transcript_18611:2669-4156(-)